MDPARTTLSATCVAPCASITANAGSTRTPSARARNSSGNAAPPIFGRLLLALVAGSLKSAALLARATARILENTAETYGTSIARLACRTPARMETAFNNCQLQTSQRPPTSSYPNQKGSHATSAAVVRTRRRYQQTQGEGGRGGSSKIKINSIFQSNIPELCTLYLFTICALSLLTLSSAAIDNTAPEQIIVFDEIGKMASSMAYLHVAIPLNISTFEQQIAIFHTYLNKLTEITTPAAKQVPFTKAIRDLAAFAKSRLSTLQTSLRFVDTILPEDTSQSAQARNKRFIGVTPLMIYTLIQDLRYKQQQSYDGDLFFPNGTFKFENSSDPLLRPQRSVPPTLPFFTTNTTSRPPPQPNHNRQKRYLPDITPFFITRFYMANLEIIRKHEGIRRQWQMYNYTKHLNSLHALLNHTTEPPPFVHVPAEPHPDPHLYDQLIRQRRQVIAGLGAVAGVLGTFLGLFNELEISSIRSQMGTLQTNQNILLHISHTHEQQIQLLHAELTHLASVINLLIQYNPALVYAKLHAQIQIVQDRLHVLQDCVQQLQHQRLAVTLLDLNQLHHMYSSVTKMAQSKGYTLLPSKPQDFFQLDTSYVRTGANVLILLHVPCLNDNYLLTIYKFANLPYPVNSFHTSTNNSDPASQLTPIHTVHDLLTSFNQPDLYSTSSEALFFLPESDLIAIGRNNGVSNRYKLLSHSD